MERRQWLAWSRAPHPRIPRVETKVATSPAGALKLTARSMSDPSSPTNPSRSSPFWYPTLKPTPRHTQRRSVETSRGNNFVRLCDADFLGVEISSRRRERNRSLPFSKHGHLERLMPARMRSQRLRAE